MLGRLPKNPTSNKTWKPAQKSLNYRYAQSLDNSIDEQILQALESRSQSPITICWDSLTSYYKISVIKTPFTIKFLYENFVYYKMSITSTPYLCPMATFLSLLFTACIIPSYSFFLSHSLRYKITYSGNHNFLSRAHRVFFVLFFLIISNFIFYNYLNSIHKLNYDRQIKIIRMSKYLPILFLFFSYLFSWLRWFQSFFFSFAARLLFLFRFFFFMPFFPWSWTVSLLFPFFFLGAWCRQLSFLFFFSFFWGAPHFVFLFLASFSCFFFLGALCFLSLLPSPEQAVRNRFLIVLNHFPDHVDHCLWVLSGCSVLLALF